MHITLETDYAVRIVDCIARNERRIGAGAIAQQNEVTLHFALKILGKLAAGGIVTSFKGGRGGYEIARPLDEITLNEILETIEGPYMFSRCLDIDHVCSKNGLERCQYYHAYKDISDVVVEKLKGITVADALHMGMPEFEVV